MRVLACITIVLTVALIFTLLKKKSGYYSNSSLQSLIKDLENFELKENESDCNEPFKKIIQKYNLVPEKLSVDERDCIRIALAKNYKKRGFTPPSAMFRLSGSMLRIPENEEIVHSFTSLQVKQNFDFIAAEIAITVLGLRLATQNTARFVKKTDVLAVKRLNENAISIMLNNDEIYEIS